MTTRDEMLARVRKALGQSNSSSTFTPLPPLDLSGFIPALAPQDYQSQFTAELEKVGGVTHKVNTLDELVEVLQQILEPAESPAVAISGNPLLKELGIAGRLAALQKQVTSWDLGAGADSLPAFNHASFAAAAGITGVDFALAETGTLVLSSFTEKVQVASLAPPIHIALYRRSQLVGSLDEVLARLPISTSQSSPSAGRSVVFVTGTSRTADIEQILVRGVHGPREIHAILVEDTCR
jgi:L-lactate dehydrogenase complex protein LldG